MTSLQRLRSLDLYSADGPADLEWLSQMTNVTHLRCWLDLLLVLRMTWLRKLRIGSGCIRAMNQVSSLRLLNSLEFREDTPTSSETFRVIAELSGLRISTYSSPKESDISPLSKLTGLEYLHAFLPSSLELPPLPSLTYLFANFSIVRNISHLTRLKYLEITCTSPYDTLSRLPSNTCLESLCLWGEDPVRLTEEHVRVLREYTNLTNLGFGAGPLLLKDLEFITPLRKLRRLHFEVEDRSIGKYLTSLTGLRELEWLILTPTRFDDISRLTILKDLPVLYLTMIPYTYHELRYLPSHSSSLRRVSELLASEC